VLYFGFDRESLVSARVGEGAWLLSVGLAVISGCHDIVDLENHFHQLSGK